MLVHTYVRTTSNGIESGGPADLEVPSSLKLGWPLSNLFALRGSCIAKGTFGLAGGELDAAQLHEAHGWASYIDSRGRWNKKASQGIAPGAGPPAFVACDVTAVKMHVQVCMDAVSGMSYSAEWLEFTT